jgi:hypothetical protein
VTSAKKSPDNSGLNNNKRLCSYLFLAAAFLGAAFFAAAFLGAAFLGAAFFALMKS